jgi:Holliday junction resolvase RusA-like endonuclease
MKTITLKIDCRAVGKPRMTQKDKWAKRPEVVAYRGWCDYFRAILVRDIGWRNMPSPEQIMDLSWRATFTPPKSWSQQKREAAIGTIHRVKPDRDNIDKAILDVLFPEAKGGDAAVGVGTLEKYWGDEDLLEISISFEA